MKGDTLELIIPFFVEARFGCFLGCISSIFIMKNDYTKFQHLKLSIDQPHGQLLCYIQYWIGTQCSENGSNMQGCIDTAYLH